MSRRRFDAAQPLARAGRVPLQSPQTAFGLKRDTRGWCMADRHGGAWGHRAHAPIDDANGSKRDSEPTAVREQGTR
jgi:hypothetical protein